MRWRCRPPVSNIDAVWNEMARSLSRNGKDEATDFRDRGSDATITHGDLREAARAEHVRDTDAMAMPKPRAPTCTTVRMLA